MRRDVPAPDADTYAALDRLERGDRFARGFLALSIAVAVAARLLGLLTEAPAPQDFGLAVLIGAATLTTIAWLGGLLFFLRDWLWSRGIGTPPGHRRVSWGQLALVSILSLFALRWAELRVLTGFADRTHGPFATRLEHAARTGAGLPRNLTSLERTLGLEVSTKTRGDLGPLRYRALEARGWRLEIPIRAKEVRFMGDALVLQGGPDGSRLSQGWTIQLMD